MLWLKTPVPVCKLAKEIFKNVCKLNFWQNLVLVTGGIAILSLGGCTTAPTKEQLEVWRKEASDRNAEIVAENAKKAQQREWNLLIQGQTADNKTIQLNWRQLLDLATTTVNTNDPNYVINPKQIFEFRGIPVAALLNKFSIKTDIKEVTFVCYDSYQVTIPFQDLLQYPIILAIAKNGQPIRRDQGGPIYLVFPYSQHPQIQQKYYESFWAFYVSNIILGTEAVKLKVGNRSLSLADLDKLQQVTINKNVGYRVGWPNSKVKLHGVRIRDIISSYQIQLMNQDHIIISSKIPVYQKDANPVTIPSAVLRQCDLILATRWGNNRQLIPAKMGGPLTLAYSDDCLDKTNNLQWLTFVEELN
ncbi:MAG TPA: molybdopterin-dependent oxidoreductase [Nostocaceae cyanobacterium]|nr:molybdopterin-dependent oxidoreductase [Nostocaceae cyanobacterium]